MKFVIILLALLILSVSNATACMPLPSYSLTVHGESGNLRVFHLDSGKIHFQSENENITIVVEYNEIINNITEVKYKNISSKYGGYNLQEFVGKSFVLKAYSNNTNIYTGNLELSYVFQEPTPNYSSGILVTLFLISLISTVVCLVLIIFKKKKRKWFKWFLIGLITTILLFFITISASTSSLC